MKAALCILALAVALTACAPEEPAPGGRLLTVEWRGGLCQYGGCSTVFEVSADGAYRLAQGDGTETLAMIDSALMDALSDAVATADFDSVRVHGSTETCPTAYDGQEVIYTFHHLDGDERMSTCEDVIEWDLPPFPEALTVLDTIRR